MIRKYQFNYSPETFLQQYDNCADELHTYVGKYVREHRVMYAVLAVGSAEDETHTAVKEEATKDYHRSESHRCRRCGQVACGEENCRQDVSDHKRPSRNSLGFFRKDLPQKKGDKRHKE